MSISIYFTYLKSFIVSSVYGYLYHTNYKRITIDIYIRIYAKFARSNSGATQLSNTPISSNAIARLKLNVTPTLVINAFVHMVSGFWGGRAARSPCPSPWVLACHSHCRCQEHAMIASRVTGGRTDSVRVATASRSSCEESDAPQARRARGWCCHERGSLQLRQWYTISRLPEGEEAGQLGRGRRQRGLSPRPRPPPSLLLPVLAALPGLLRAFCNAPSGSS